MTYELMAGSSSSSLLAGMEASTRNAGTIVVAFALPEIEMKG